jgi:hypothetical protein
MAMCRALVLAALTLACLPLAAVAQTGDADLEGWADVGQAGDGVVVWESDRTGRWRIWARDLDGGRLRQVTPDEDGRDHYCPHISPDGQRLLYLSYPRNRNGYQDHRSTDAVPLHLLDLATGADSIVTDDARAYFEHRAAVWVDANTFNYIDGSGQTFEHDLTTGRSQAQTTAKHEDYGWLLNATKTHATAGVPEFSLYDASTQQIAARQRQGGCQPYFTHDGVWGYWMSGGGGPVRRMNLATRETSTILHKNDPSLPSNRSYIYFPMSSYRSELFAFGASPNQHDHHTADYDIFVARTDPATLEIIGTPARYSFDGGTDRFPDVYVRALELGRRQGEAPFTVEFEAPRGPDAGKWRWTSGDGRKRDGDSFKHTYDEPGVYRVAVRRGDQTLRGEIAVSPRKRPAPMAAYVRGDNEIVVTFDEPVQERRGKARLESGGKIDEWRWEDGGLRVVLVTDRGITGEDLLRLEDVRDRAQKSNKMEKARLAIRPPAWPSSRDALVVGWSAGEADVAGVADGVWRSYTMSRQGATRDAWDGALRLANGSNAVGGASDALLQACRKSNELTVEAVVLPANIRQGGPARIVSFSSSTASRNFTLGQEEEWLVFRLRTPNTDGNGTRHQARLCRVDDREPMHVVVSYRPGRLVCYANGKQVTDTDAITGDLSNWEPQHLLLGDEWGGGRDWSGELQAFALYSRAMDADEAARNHHDFVQLRDARRAAIPVVWPSDRDQAVFVWGTARHDNLVDIDGVQRVYNVLPRGRGRLDRNYAMAVGGGAFVSPDVDEAMLRRLTSSNKLTVEAVVRPGATLQDGPARIVSFSTDGGSRNFTLAQQGDELVFRLRTPQTGVNGSNPETPLCSIPTGRYTHVLVTYSPGRLVCYSNGVKVIDTDRIQGDFRNWGPQHIVFGDEWRDDRDWDGVLEGIAVYSRVLDAPEARANYEAYRRILEAREAVQETDARVTLIARSDVPRLEDIQPYREALVVYEYDIEGVTRGPMVAGRIRVAHWAILDGETLAVARWDDGQKQRLRLEPFEDNPQLETFYMSDTLAPDFDVPLYYAVQP